MSNALLIPTAGDPLAHRKRWTVDDCRKLEAMELLIPGTYELIDGEIVEKVGQNEPHTFCNKKTFLALSLLFGPEYVRLPAPINVNLTNNPEPDVCVTVHADAVYLLRGRPTAADMRLIVEVSDTTLWYDCNTKMRIYSGANVPEYWVLDIVNRRLIVHRDPTPTGYATITEYDETQSVAPMAAPNTPVHVADLLP